ncbi:MAG TPA: glutathione S-transferase family protein [Polyangiaceae bacterium]
MLLIGQFDSPFVRRVAITLGHYGMPFEQRPWSVWAHSEELARYNPLRRVPVLVLANDEVLVESAAILDYLDELAGEPSALLPRTGAVRRDGLRVCAFATGLADKAVSLLYEHVLRGERSEPRWVKRCEDQIRDVVELLEQDRARRTTRCWLGDRFSHADISVACALRFLSEAHPQLFEQARYPYLAAHAAECEALPVFLQYQQTLSVTLSR